MFASGCVSTEQSFSIAFTKKKAFKCHLASHLCLHTLYSDLIQSQYALYDQNFISSNTVQIQNMPSFYSTVMVSIWEGNQCKKAQLTLMEISTAIKNKVVSLLVYLLPFKRRVLTLAQSKCLQSHYFLLVKLIYTQRKRFCCRQ